MFDSSDDATTGSGSGVDPLTTRTSLIWDSAVGGIVPVQVAEEAAVEAEVAQKARRDPSPATATARNALRIHLH